MNPAKPDEHITERSPHTVSATPLASGADAVVNANRILLTQALEQVDAAWEPSTGNLGERQIAVRDRCRNVMTKIKELGLGLDTLTTSEGVHLLQRSAFVDQTEEDADVQEHRGGGALGFETSMSLMEILTPRLIQQQQELFEKIRETETLLLKYYNDIGRQFGKLGVKRTNYNEYAAQWFWTRWAIYWTERNAVTTWTENEEEERSELEDEKKAWEAVRGQTVEEMEDFCRKGVNQLWSNDGNRVLVMAEALLWSLALNGKEKTEEEKKIVDRAIVVSCTFKQAHFGDPRIRSDGGEYGSEANPVWLYDQLRGNKKWKRDPSLTPPTL